MIVVIADDLTGAGEIAGMGLAYGLKAEIQREFCPDSDTQLLIIDTDTRSLSPEEAGRVLRGLARQLNDATLSIEWIYKKVDSVFRGPVASELKALREGLNAAKVLLVPANPSKGRIIRDGAYFIDGKLLSETDFANDPEYPATTSCVVEMPALSGSDQIHVLKNDQPFPGEGIIIGQAETTNDLLRWAERIDEQTILAGAVEFFEAMLKNMGFSKEKGVDGNGYPSESLALFICGSSSDASRQALRNAEARGLQVCRMPETLFKAAQSGDVSFQQWVDEIAECFKSSHSVIAAIDREVVKHAEFAGKLRSVMAVMVVAIFQKIPLQELVVEGGATASQIVARLGWDRFEPCDQLAPGVVRMRIWGSENIYLTIKPGSYPWPESIWKKERSKAE